MFCIWKSEHVTPFLGRIAHLYHIFRIVWIIISACLIKQPNGTLSRMYVQTYISFKRVVVSVDSEAWNECSLECTSLHCNNSAVGTTEVK